MSIEEVRSQIERFVTSDAAEVLCIRGKWGTGKTYNWCMTLKELVDENKKISRSKYAYVSLFGVNDLNDLKQEIIYQTTDVDQIGKDFVFQDVESYVKSAFPGLLKLGGWVGKILGENYTSAGVAVMYMLVRNRLICIDDLERKGKELRSADVLGLVSQLREYRNCKVVLLLNDDGLGEEDRGEFARYLEKVVDISLRFKPTAEEVAEIALAAMDGAEETKRLVRERTTKLGIDNVRVIRKIYSFVQQIQPLLRGYKRDVFISVTSAIVLLGWCHLQPELAPSKEFIVRRRGALIDHIAKNKGELTEKEQGWVSLIADYGYTHTDELDLELLRGIEDGYFTREAIERHATELNQRVEADNAVGQLRETWRDFYDSFDDDWDVHLNRFKRCINSNARFYSLNDMISVVNMFRDMGCKDEGDELLEIYLEARQDVVGALDLEELRLFGTHIDPDIEKKLRELEEERKPTPSVEELFLMLADNGFDQKVTERLAALPVGDYVSVLKNNKGRKLGEIRRGLTQYNNLVNPDDFAVEIMRKTNEALQQIAQESKLNAYRVRRWGIAERLESLPPDVSHGGTAESSGSE